MKPFCSESCSVDASTFWLIWPIVRRSSLKRRDPRLSTPITGIDHLSLFRASIWLMCWQAAVSSWFAGAAKASPCWVIASVQHRF